LSTRDERFSDEGRGDYRLPAQVDRDRIQYASVFARLAEVTQVVSADKGHVFHNRLTHSLKVAQLARRIAEKLAAEQPEVARELGGLDPDAAEAAALAHDLGHPPFGHLAEEVLDELCREYGLSDGFEGNAQSFRIVTKIAVGDASSPLGISISGLNLTRASLNGILKYPWCHGENPAKPRKWGAYDSEREIFQWVRAEQPFGENVKSVEAELMDWADDITFSVHDLLDFYCAGQIPLDQLASDNPESEERAAFFEEVFDRNKELLDRRGDLEKAFNEIVVLFPLNRRYVGSRDQRCALWQFTTVLISRYVDAISLIESTKGGPAVKILTHAQDEIQMLKELTWHYVILHNDLATNQRGHSLMVRTVFAELKSAADNRKSWKLFPPFFKDQLQDAGNDIQKTTRLISDYISSMTEKELSRAFHALTGRQ
jgi:dGTPase